MPRIPENWLDSVVYLYPSETAARESRPVGGTGFFIGVPLESDDPTFPHTMHTYIVTNEHVARRGNPVVRVNSENGKFQTLDLNHNDWIPHPSGEDIAITPLKLYEGFDYTPIPAGSLVTRKEVEDGSVGIGDEAFLIGRYVHLDGTDRNRATVRFGNISALPGEPIVQRQRKNHRQDSFLVEMRSLSGFSGSPVFGYRMGAVMPGVLPHNEGHMVVGGMAEGPIHLLGIDWGHHPFAEPVLDAATREPVSDGTFVAGNSGMAMVVPGWQLFDWLTEDADLMAARKDQESEWKRQHEHEDGAAVLDSANPAAEYDAFADLTKNLLSVSKVELDNARADEKPKPA